MRRYRVNNYPFRLLLVNHHLLNYPYLFYLLHGSENEWETGNLLSDPCPIIEIAPICIEPGPPVLNHL